MKACVRRMLLLTVFVAAFVATLPVLASSGNALYLPLTLAAPNPHAPTPTPLPPATPQPTPMPSTQKPFFLEGSSSDPQNTSTPDLLIDSAGNIHIAYITFRRNNTKAVYYAFCAASGSGCSRAQDFTTTTFSFSNPDDAPSDVTLALDNAGHPRMLWAASHVYQYLSCNTNCTDSTNWTATNAAQFHNIADYHSRRFAIDAQGRPSFVYLDDTLGDHTGTWYAFCAEADCTNAANWQETQVATAFLELPSLDLTTSGNPRFAGRMHGSNKLVYLECNVTCSDANNWNGVVFDAINPYYSAFSLQVGSDNLPRLAVAPGDVSNSFFTANTLFYLACTTACGDGSTNDWSGGPINTPGKAGDTVALVLTLQDQPRLLYQDQNTGMVYLACDASCNANDATWQSQQIETVASVNASEPVPPTTACASPLNQTWSLGYWASLALDSSGHPRAAYDAQHLVTCSSGGKIQVETDIAWARFAP